MELSEGVAVGEQRAGGKHCWAGNESEQRGSPGMEEPYLAGFKVAGGEVGVCQEAGQVR